jgi:hypothetical protein
LELSRYIHLNPVRAGLVEEASGYSWSSYAGYAGGKGAWDWLRCDFILGQMGSDKGEAQRRYRAYIGEAMEKGSNDPLGKVVASTFLGSEPFLDWVRKKWVRGAKPNRDIPALMRFKTGPNIPAIVREVERVFGREAQSRKVALYLSHRLSGLGLEEIGKFFGIGPSGVSQNARRVEMALKEDEELANEIEKVERGFGE